ncbi:hypothetical protein [Wenjunlia tyrosinilytica]|jgi:hypothetical protein|uniref:Lipoprotein n=1 Tax=Wenjunlia tyrosinilytica TaxID=1544741 RepID=A0A917ZM92_9ACTN|nr:hypothetical protein [Wenjunlia tyrosinilytica]GGO85778.1 hypothetical protein GCM10012280_20350 [Wenjunlia tyrosinilytica]
MSIKHTLAATAVVCLAFGGVAGCGNSSGDSGKDDGKKAGSPSGDQGRAQGKPNGVEKLSAQQISEKARAELKNASSLRLVMDTAAAKTDLAIDRDGNCSGTAGSAKGQMEIIKRGEDVYVKPDSQFWATQGGSKGAAAKEVVGDRYIKTSVNDPQFGQAAGMCDLDAFTKDMDGDNDDKMAKGGTSTVDGVPVVALKGTKGSDKSTLYVATVGKPYVIKIVGTDDGRPASMGFKDYDKPVPSRTPGAGEVLDAAKLKELGTS